MWPGDHHRPHRGRPRMAKASRAGTLWLRKLCFHPDLPCRRELLRYVVRDRSRAAYAQRPGNDRASDPLRGARCGNPVGKARLAHINGTILTYVGSCRMDDKAGDLRRHADHCRRLAIGSVSERTRTILRAMATEFDVQARDIDAAKPILPH